MTSKTTKNKVPCEDGCIRCGTCCVVLRINTFHDRFYKPSYVACPHLEYSGSQTSCKLFDSDARPKRCALTTRRLSQKKIVMESRMTSFRQNDLVRHYIWLYNNGFLEHLPFIQDIRNCVYQRSKLFFRVFIYPYIKNIAGTLPSYDNWFQLWGLKNYFMNMPREFELEMAKFSKETCMRLYDKNMPQQVENLLNDIDGCLHGKWIRILKKMIWGK